MPVLKVDGSGADRRQLSSGGRDEQDLLRLFTAGSVDDGKSTLIGRLLYDTQAVFDDQMSALQRDSQRRGSSDGEVDLSLLTDGLKAEREQGITIDVAYRYFSTPRRSFVIADCPGHEQYTRNMATGASNCDLAIILVDARHGVLTQTRRHSFIVSLLGIRHVVVAVNKMDLVGYAQEVFDTIEQSYRDFSARLGLADLRFIPLSALKGDNVVTPSRQMPWYTGETLLHFLETAHIASDRNLIDLRFPVQYVIRPNQDFRGFAGTVASGIIRKDDDVMVLPSGRRSRVRSIVTYDGELTEAFPPQAVTVTLADEVDVSRGDMLVHPGNLPRLEQTFEAMIVWMGDEPMSTGRPYVLKHATNLVQGQVSAIRYRLNVNTLQRETATALAMNEVGRCTVRVSRALAIDAYERNRTTGAFILISRATNVTVGAGLIVDRNTSIKLLQDLWGAEPSVSGAPAPSRVTAAERESRDGQRPVTVLLTGLSGSGKTTLACAVERALFDRGYHSMVLDGQRMRATINLDLGFSSPERSENLRRSMQVARLLNDAGLICLCAFVAPDATVREKARATVGGERFLEVHVSAPLDVCRTRDRDRVYDRADAGDLHDVSGLTTPYDTPAHPDLRLATDELSIDACVAQVLTLLEARGLLRKRQEG
ncbi:MAG: sulfate adenylyltransferase subunit CysN [Vicinamibacterales bacterium]